MGLAGADSYCAMLARGVGAGDRDWKAYLSTSAENARDRIGMGPWFNAAGTMVAADLAALHANSIAEADMLDEAGAAVPANEHDILTGSDGDGMAMNQTCNDWTSSDNGDSGRVGHTDWEPNQSWNSQHNVNCTQPRS